MNDQKTSYLEEARSLGHLLHLSCREWGAKTALIEPTKSGARQISYAELYEYAFAYSAALVALGVKRGSTVAIFAENSFHWAMTDWACQTLGAILVPIYPTLPADQVRYIVNDCEASILLVGSKQLEEKIKSEVGVRTVLLCGDEGSIEDLSKNSHLDREAWESGIIEIEPEDLATIIYTSGTTGQPKGAMLPHRTFLFLCRNIRSSLPVSESDTFLGFLPLSHVYERMAGHVLPIAIGATIVRSQSLAALAKEMLAYRPTVMLCVPRFLEATQGRIIDAVNKGSVISRTLFNLTLIQGRAKVSGRAAPLHGLLDKLVAKRVRSMTGGRIRFFVSGGMALSPTVSNFYRSLGLNVLQGYGLTETCAVTSVNHPDRNDPTTVGEPINGVEVKIADDGEILVRGPNLMTGYFHLPDATAEAIDSEGFFHTGDIGNFKCGKLQITDRKKDILVLSNGKNVAPQPIENLLRESSYISEAVLFGDSMQYVCALIVPDFDRLSAYCENSGLKCDEPGELVKLGPIRALIKSEIDKVNKELADFEKIKKYELICHKFSIETGELTPSLKVRRKVVQEKFKEELQRMQR